MLLRQGYLAVLDQVGTQKHGTETRIDFRVGLDTEYEAQLLGRHPRNGLGTRTLQELGTASTRSFASEPYSYDPPGRHHLFVPGTHARTRLP